MYDVICESVIPTIPPDQPGAGDRVRRDLPSYDAALHVADAFVHRFGRLPDVRVLIYDQEIMRTIVVHEATIGEAAS